MSLIRKAILSAVERIIVRKNPALLDNDKLLAGVCLQVHTIEKRAMVESVVDCCDVLRARKYYLEAKKRNIFSREEINWCERVLFAVDGLGHAENITDEFQRIIHNRRSVRQWGGPITEEEFLGLVDAARWAPSSCNRQPWHFIMVNDPSKIRILSKLRGQKFVEYAPCCIIVLINMGIYNDRERGYTPYLDAGAVIENVLLAASARGLGACWVNFGRLEVSDENRSMANELFSVRRNYEIVSLIPIGRTAHQPLAPGRRSVKEIASDDAFDCIQTQKQ